MSANPYTKYLADSISGQYGPNFKATDKALAPFIAHVETNLRAGGYDQRTIASEVARAREAAEELIGPAADPAQPPQQTSPRKLLTKRIMIALAALVVYTTPLALFFYESSNDKFLSTESDVALGLRISVVHFPHTTLSRSIMPAGGTLLKPNNRLVSDVTVELDPGTGTLSHTFKADTPLVPWTVNASADSGDILDYPFDDYEVDFDIEATSADKRLHVKSGIIHVPHGLKASHTESELDDGGTNVVLRIHRTPTIIFVTLLATFSLFLVTCAACNVAWQVAYRGRKIEFSMMVWVAALLFVIPTVRNGLPGGVPPGALIDFAVFFWLQLATVCAMGSLVWTWTRRGTA